MLIRFTGAISHVFVTLATSVIIFAAPAPASAATYYVAPLSTDCTPSTPGAGTLANPWTNLFYALTQGNLQPGDVLQLRGGTYRGSHNGFRGDCNISGIDGLYTVMPLNRAGTLASRIVIENYPGETVIIDGTDADMATVTWTPCGTSSWQTSALNVGTGDSAQIWVNPSGPGEPGTRLRFRYGGSCLGLQPGEFALDMVNTSSVYVRLPGNNNPNNADIRMSCEAGDCAPYPIHAVAGANWITIRHNPAGGAFYVKYGYYGLFVDANAQNITVDGVHFIGAGGRDYGSCVRVYDGDFITIENGVCRESMGEGILFYGGGPGGAGAEPGIQISNNIVENMDVSATGRAWVDEGGIGNNLGMGIVLKNCNSCIVRRNRVRDSYGPAVHVTTSETPGMRTDGVLVERNTIWNYGYLNSTFGNRDVAGISLAPQTAGGMTGGTIQNNQIYNGMAAHVAWADGIRVSAGGLTPITGLLILNNSLSDINGPCINLRENPAPATLRNNAMTSCSTKGLTCGGGGRCNLYVDPSIHTHTNNTYWTANASDIAVRIAENTTIVDYLRSNILAYEPSTIAANPQFTSTTNLKPQAGSPLIDAGTNTDCPGVDHGGAARPFGARCDVGAFEVGSPPPGAPRNVRVKKTPTG